MRWLATADIHFSNNLPYSKVDWDTGVSDRLDDLGRLADFLIECGAKHKARGLLILGDSFDRNLLDAVTLTFASQWMRRVASHFNEVVVLPGNHESHDARSIHFTNQWLEAFGNVRVPSSPTEVGCFCFAPYMPLPKLRQALREIKSRKGRVLCTHATFYGASEYGHTFMDGLRPRDVDGFDLVLSGHVHTPQRLTGINGRYLGSPYAIDFRDESAKKVWLLDDVPPFKLRAVAVPEDVAVPFHTITVDLFVDGSVKQLSRALPGMTGYLRVKIRGAQLAINRFAEELRVKLPEGQFRHITLMRQVVREKVKARAAELGEGASVDLERAVGIWVNAIELPPHLKTSKLERVGHELLGEAVASTGTVVRHKVNVETVSLSVRDFMVIGEALKLPLDDAGLVLIRARNKDSTGADSNGAGKTTLFKALTWVLYGRTIYGEVGNDVIRKGAKEARVTLVLRVDGKRVVVRRIKARAGSAILEIKRDGKSHSGGVSDLQQEVDGMLGMDFETFRNAVLFGQDDMRRFADPKTPDAARKVIFRDILGLGCLDAARDLAKDKHKDAVAAIEECERESIVYKTLIESGKFERMQEQEAEWRSERKATIGGIKDELRALRTEYEAKHGADEDALATARLAVKAAKQAVLEIDRERDALREKREEIAANRASDASRWSAEESRLVTLLERYERDAKLLENETCPVCGTTLEEGAGAVKRRDARHLVKHTANTLAGLRAAIAAATDVYSKKLDALATKIHALGDLPLRTANQTKREADEQLETLLSKDAARSGAAARLEALGKRLSEKRDELNPYTTLANEAAIERNKALVNLKRLEEELSGLRVLAERFKFWVDGFGNAGMQSWIMDTVIPRLNERINEHLAVLSDGDIQVLVDTESVTKAGAARDKFSIAANIEDNGETRPSGGQQRKIELAVGLGLMDLVAEREGANVTLLLLDEVFDGLDGTGKDRVMLLLSQLRRRKGSILVVSHDPELRGGHDFDSVWTVTKRRGAAKVTAARV